jgi:hypothetical protein
MRLMTCVLCLSVIVVCLVLLTGCPSVPPLDCSGRWVAVTKGGHVVGVVYFGDDCESGKY